MKPINVRQFFKKFPTDEACLEHLFTVRYGQGHACPWCKRAARWYRLTSGQAFSCQWCGHRIHPMVGSIFEKSRPPLQLWFYAMFLFTNTRHGVSARELQRQLGVRYKTAWRMATLIRKHMGAVDGVLRLTAKARLSKLTKPVSAARPKASVVAVPTTKPPL